MRLPVEFSSSVTLVTRPYLAENTLHLHSSTAVHCENHTKHINALCGQDAETFSNVEACVTYNY
jgi:hypothetical protein